DMWDVGSVFACAVTTGSTRNAALLHAGSAAEKVSRANAAAELAYVCSPGSSSMARRHQARRASPPIPARSSSDGGSATASNVSARRRTEIVFFEQLRVPDGSPQVATIQVH